MYQMKYVITYIIFADNEPGVDVFISSKMNAMKPYQVLGLLLGLALCERIKYIPLILFPISICWHIRHMWLVCTAIKIILPLLHQCHHRTHVDLRTRVHIFTFCRQLWICTYQNNKRCHFFVSTALFWHYQIRHVTLNNNFKTIWAAEDCNKSTRRKPLSIDIFVCSFEHFALKSDASISSVP